MNRFFHAQNAHQNLKANGRSYKFELYQFLGGTWHGVLVTRTEQEHADLEAIVAANKSVTEITAEEWSRCIKLRAGYQPSNGLIESNPPQIEQPVEPTPEPVPIKTIAPLETVDAALNVGRVSQEVIPPVEPPAPAPAPEPATQPQPATEPERTPRRKRHIG